MIAIQFIIFPLATLIVPNVFPITIGDIYRNMHPGNVHVHHRVQIHEMQGFHWNFSSDEQYTHPQFLREQIEFPALLP